METSIVKAKNEITRQLGDKETFTMLLSTTFKGLNAAVVKRAILEGVLRGFTFKDFLEKNIYAIPFRDGYSLVSSIDYARKIGMRSGIVGKSAPTFEMDNKSIVSCTITVKRQVSGVVGEWTATVFFNEYTTGKNLWNSKPRTMIAKVAEMHALRMACPEEMSQMYSEEELDKEKETEDFDRSEIEDNAKVVVAVDEGEAKPTPLQELKKIIDDTVLEPIENDKGYDEYVLSNTALELKPENYPVIKERLLALKK